jgi:hypothetical protein
MASPNLENALAGEKIAALQKRVNQLEYRVDQLMSLVDPRSRPFTYHMIEVHASEGQVSAVLNLMDEVRAQLDAKQEAMNHGQFEQRIYDIFPARNGDYHFAEGIVSTLKEERRWEEVFEHFKANGMNIN